MTSAIQFVASFIITASIWSAGLVTFLPVVGRWRNRLILDRMVLTYRTIFWELRPLFLPAVTVDAAITLAHHELPWWTPVFLLGYFLPPGDDDRWRRRRAKLAAAIRRRGTRLVVIPTPAGTR